VTEVLSGFTQHTSLHVVDMREKRAEQRAERVAKGADIPAEPLAPIEHRRLLNSLQAKLATLSTSFEVVHVRLRTDIRFAPLRLNFQ
jgi:hypothetical protein